jgi:Sporulation and spore germination
MAGSSPKRQHGGESAAMIPRYQKILFVILLLASAIMGAELWHLRDRAHQRLLAVQDSAPTRAPEAAPVEQATLMVANDAEDALDTKALSLPLPPGPNERARVLIEKLLDTYAAPDSTHPVSGGAQSVIEVFLMPEAKVAAKTTARPTEANATHHAQNTDHMAVVNLSGTFAANHPSGIEAETLTILSICSTLHANLPQISRVRFLVDGEPRVTLAGHADLTRTYLAGDTETVQGAQQ